MYNNVIHAPAYYKVGIYIRLSQEDRGKSYESDSESVLNQRTILTNYVNSKGFSFIKEYAITEGETIETILTRLFLKK